MCKYFDKNMKHIEATKQVLEEKVFKTFGSHFAQIFGPIISKNSKYNVQDLLRPILLATLENTSIEDICSDFELCSADTIQRRINQLNFSELEHKMQEMLEMLFKSFRIHRNQKISLAIDITEFLYYGKKLIPVVTGTKPQNNTHRSIQFFTASILTDTYIIPIYLRVITSEYPRKPKTLIQDLLSTLDSKIAISRILGDSYFFNAEVCELLKNKNLEYIFNLKEYSTIKSTIQEEIDFKIRLAENSGVDISKPKILFKWLKKNRLDNFKFETSYDSKPETLFTVAIQLFLVKKKDEDKKKVDTLIWFSYASNTLVSVECLVELYKKRWGIETHYRVERQFLAKTCSRSDNFRLLLFGFSLLFDSLWLILNALLNRKSDPKGAQNININYLRIYKSDKLLITVKKFIRRLLYLLKEMVKFKK